MTEMLQLMAAPFAACVVLVGIHAYLGLHVIQRKVIFVDLALAQIAALGGTFGFLVGMSPHGTGAYFFSVGFAMVGAAIFALTRMRHEHVPQEAIIGVVYAAALALAIQVADRAPEGAEHIKETLVGVLLWVRWPTVFKTAAIYALIGAMHVAFRRRFFQISFEPEQAYAEKRWIRLWDFLFYGTFAFVITSSVAIAGVLLVFSFLVIPAVIAVLFVSRVSTRLAIGWSVGIAACLVGLVASYRLDMPSGPSVVTSLALALVVAALIRYVLSAERREHATLKVLAGVAAVAVCVAGSGVFFTSGTFMHVVHQHEWEAREQAGGSAAGDDGFWAELAAACGGDPACAAPRLVEKADWRSLAQRALRNADHDRREWAVEVLALAGGPESLDLLADAAASEGDLLLRLQQARALTDAGDRRGLRIAVDLLVDETPAVIRDDAHQILTKRAGRDFGFDPFAAKGVNDGAIARWREWADAL